MHSLSKNFKKISWYLRLHRNARGMSQLEVANRAAISYRTYQRIETGMSMPRLDTLVKILDFLEVHQVLFADNLVKIVPLDHDVRKVCRLASFENPVDLANLKTCLEDLHGFNSKCLFELRGLSVAVKTGSFVGECSEIAKRLPVHFWVEFWFAAHKANSRVGIARFESGALCDGAFEFYYMFMDGAGEVSRALIAVRDLTTG